MRIAVDIDSTLHHYWDLFEVAANRRYGVQLPYERQRTWRIPELEPDQLRAVVEDTHGDASILSAQPYPGAVEALARWHGQGHWIHVTSHRSGRAHGATARWLDDIGLPYDDLHCSFDKLTRCRELEIDVLIDDSPVNLAGAREAGITGATLIHPWNRELCASGRVIAAEDWPALALALEPALSGARPDPKE